MNSIIKELVDVCNDSELRIYWNVDTLSFVKREYKLTEPYWYFDDGDGDGEYGKYIIYHQGSYSIVKLYDDKVINLTPSHPSVNMYIEMQLEEVNRITDQLNSLELEEDLLDIIDELEAARLKILNDHVSWFFQNNHESIKKSYQRNQIISNVLA